VIIRPYEIKPNGGKNYRKDITADSENSKAR
jgi:hypothetical protein